MRSTAITTGGMLLGLLAACAAPGCDQNGSRGSSSYDWLEEMGGMGALQPRPQPRPNPIAEIFSAHRTSGSDKDGNYTILLHMSRGEGGQHIKRAKYYKTNTEKHAGWKYLFVVHRADHSLLYWGRYKALEDARPNLRKAKAYRTPAGIAVYAQAMIVPVPGTEDLGPPEWNLANVTQPYVYTVMRAVFYDVPEANYIGRRRFAVDYCKQLRRQNVEAYYKHDPAQSIVTIGRFGPSAVVEIKRGKKTERVVRDGRIKAVFKRFPHLAVNGRQKMLQMVNAKTGKKQQVPASTYLMEIPREKVSHERTPRRRSPDRLGYPKPRQAPRNPPGPGGVAGSGGRPGSVR